MIKLDIANKHKRKFVAFAVSVNNIEHIVASDTKTKLLKFLFCNNNIFEDFYIFNQKGNLVDAYQYKQYSPLETISRQMSPPYVQIQF